MKTSELTPLIDALEETWYTIPELSPYPNSASIMRESDGLTLIVKLLISGTPTTNRYQISLWKSGPSPLSEDRQDFYEVIPLRSPSITITVTASKPWSRIATDIQRRLLPEATEYWDWACAAVEKLRQQRRDLETFTAACTSAAPFLRPSQNGTSGTRTHFFVCLGDAEERTSGTTDAEPTNVSFKLSVPPQLGLQLITVIGHAYANNR